MYGAIRCFLRTNYSDQHLLSLIAHMEDKKFDFYSCCCFIGIPTATHALQGKNNHYRSDSLEGLHYQAARRLFGAIEAEQEVYGLVINGNQGLLLDLAKEELAYRESLRSTPDEEKEVAVL